MGYSGHFSEEIFKSIQRHSDVFCIHNSSLVRFTNATNSQNLFDGDGKVLSLQLF